MERKPPNFTPFRHRWQVDSFHFLKSTLSVVIYSESSIHSLIRNLDVIEVLAAPLDAAIHHGFGLASPALAGTPLALISAAALFTLYHMKRRSGKSGASGSDD